jgi:hypothetical protein
MVNGALYLTLNNVTLAIDAANCIKLAAWRRRDLIRDSFGLGAHSSEPPASQFPRISVCMASSHAATRIASL